ncbi:YdeI/OmpD-associated family protein [Streptomyces sp. MB22_4]|uniref:YdeI/OmpD-associated family protein n=1 Tax=Streptomyces sp. MB22_4 TaxID=3383120 RepID=UPI0039A2F17F
MRTMSGNSTHATDPVLSFATRQAWETWLEENHEDATGVWLKLARKNSAAPAPDGVDHPTALESALCFGWIDGQKRKLDEGHWLQRFTPRRPTSRWSQVNRDKAVRLIEEGRMRPAGLREVERARADGRWAAAYAGQRTATVPDDLRAALDATPAAAAFFATLDGHNRYAVLHRVEAAKKPETRAARIARFVAMLADRKKLHP